MDILKSFGHPEELLALFRFKFGGCDAVIPKYDYGTMSPSMKVCLDLLTKTSRSFASVIQALDVELRGAVCNFYLVLRALDTVEDDMTIPNEVKVPMLKQFHKNLEDPDWKFMDSKDKDAVVWSKYRPSIGDFAKPEHQQEALACLNELITNALELIPSSLHFMSRLHNQSVFNFVAIPQVMAIATLERCYNNPKVFSGVVKIRKGEAVRMMMGSSSFDKVKAIMKHFVVQIQARIPESDPHSKQTHSLCQKAISLCDTSQQYSTSNIYPPLYVSMGLTLSAIAYTYWSQIGQWYEDLL
ncbi:squalene synthase-like [Elysia marginata]|uniref:Squalene synthase-like n=1 Tax=Elysia marginata TaxID=1093978 RepID=A0AAV4HHV1_9GAST|nr:squalene synthase-like [Elysia marginata]